MKKYLAIVVGIAVFSGLWSSAARADAPIGGAAGVVETKKEEKVPFYGVSFDLTVGDSSGLNGIGHNYANDLNFYFEPSWHVGAKYLRHIAPLKNLEIAGRFVVTQNLSGTNEANFNAVANSGPQGTCGNFVPNQNGSINPGQVPYCNPAGNDRRADYSDIWLTVRAPKAYTIPKADIHLNPSMRFYLPTSAESRAQTMVFGWLTSLGASRTFWKDRISLSTSFGFLKNFHQSSTPQVNGSGTGPGAATGNNPYDGVSGISANFFSDPARAGDASSYNTNFSLLGSFSAGYKFNEKWSFDVLYILIGSFPYNHSCLVTTQGVTVDTCASGDAVAANSGTGLARPGNHDSQVFWSTLNYQALDYLGVYLAWINWAPLLNKDSTYRQGIISTNYDAFTSISLGVTLSIDKLGSKFIRN